MGPLTKKCGQPLVAGIVWEVDFPGATGRGSSECEHLDFTFLDPF